MRKMLVFQLFLLGMFQLCLVQSWREWTWNSSDPNPGKRRGHSLVLHKSSIVIFGGRSDDIKVEHSPRTYEIHEVNGVLEFKTYSDKPVKNHCSTADIGNLSHPCHTKKNFIQIGLYFNDVWSYDINCARYADEGCIDKTWKQLNKGSKGGGCKTVFGAELCTHPTERWFHAAETFFDNSMMIYGGFSLRCEDYCDDMWSFTFEDNLWTEAVELGNKNFGPGKRYKFSSVGDSYKMYIFGGFRLWHGFSAQNSEQNNWEDLSDYPPGGYLDDFWIYNRAGNNWTKVQVKEECSKVNVLEWDKRKQVECKTLWPPSRAGHVSVIMDNILYIHGGYRTFFPYPATNGPGAGRGITTKGVNGFSPFPTGPYYLDDLWKYNFKTGLWTALNPILTSKFKPSSRTDHSMVAANGILVLYGGYRSNYFYDDTWQFNTTANQWLQQTYFVHAIYPSSCTDDLIHRKNNHSGVYRPWKIPSHIAKADNFHFIKERHYGTEKFSVSAQPTRDMPLPKDKHVFISQARRQAPGWDGCRDRADGRKDLPQKLQWIHPSQRSEHRAVYHNDSQLMLIHGGYSFSRESLYESSFTTAANTVGDLWQYSLANCPKNCSMHGQCVYGKCKCDDGYYGLECSNMTCPGSVCRFDETFKTQSCVHCCFSGFDHFSNDDTYIPNLQKLPCSNDQPQFSNGVCDGFGKCICKPTFIGEDCSIRDCKQNCTGHGFCSVEFPNSRCLCDDGWIGEYCDQRVCLNNCSYPNGNCINGTCWCKMINEPYNSSFAYLPFLGEDCSFMIPFSIGTQTRVGMCCIFAIISSVLLVIKI